MIQSILNGPADVFTLVNLFMIFVGCFIRIVFGVIPRPSTDLAVILFLLLTYSMGISPDILFLPGIYCGGTYGGSITTVLIGTPGTNAAMAIVFDGYPLAQKGKPRKVLQMCLFASTTGELLSSLVLLFTAPFISEFVLKFAVPGHSALSVFGIPITAGVSGNSTMQEIFIGYLGILTAYVGINVSSGATRFAFGNVHLMKRPGLPLVLLEVFVLPNILNQIYSKSYLEKFVYNRELNREDALTKEGRKRCMPIILRSIGADALIEAVPGAGVDIAAFMAYNEGKQVSKNGDKSGIGELEDIAMPEAANNAVTGCSLIPLFTLGISGSVVAAPLIGAFTVKGPAPGPMLLRSQLALMYAIIAGMIVANVAMFLEGKYLLRSFMKTLWLSQPILFTELALFCATSSYSFSNHMFNMYVLVLFGIVMYALQKMEFPGAPFVLEVVLGSLVEGDLKNSLVMSDGSWLIFFKRPIYIVILLITVLFTLYSIKKTRSLKKSGARAAGVGEATALEDWLLLR